MKVETKLLELEARQPRVLLVPTLWAQARTPVWPISPTEALLWYRSWGRPGWNEETAERADGALHFPPWGWCDVVEPVFLDAAEEQGGTFKTGLAVARAICKADSWLKPCRVGKECMLKAMLVRDTAALLFTAAFWLRSRQSAFVAIIEEMAENKQREAEGQRLPVVLAGHLTAPPETTIQ